MLYELPKEYIGFPDPEGAEPDGLVAFGGELSVPYLVGAYVSGLFPWFIQDDEPFWFSPDPRMLLYPDEFRYSKSLRRVVKSAKFEVKIDTQFQEVMLRCGDTQREDQDGTWVTPEFVSAYTELHQLGLAHSFETYYQGRLVGGLYGVSMGQCFFGESMFHTMTDASKVAFVRLVEFCKTHHFIFIDAQQETPHLASLGAKPVPRRDYLGMLATQDWNTTLVGSWEKL